MAQSACEGCWVSAMADELTCEIVQQLTGIQLTLLPELVQSEVRMDIVHGFVSGECEMQLRFEAAPSTFCHFARNMIGAEPEDEQEVQEYATEIFNVLCGRFVSEVCQMAHITTRFSPTVYEAASKIDMYPASDAVCTLCFQSEDQALVRFSWTRGTLEKLKQEERLQ